jgi:hypothetical protein
MHARAMTFILAMRVWSDEAWSDEATGEPSWREVETMRGCRGERKHRAETEERESCS